MPVAAVPHPRRERDIDLGPLGRPLTRLVDRSRAGIPRLLMEGAEDHGRVPHEDLLRPVPVVDVPVQNEHPGQAVGLERVTGGQRGVVEDAEPSPQAFPRVVARRTDEGDGHTARPAGHGVHREERRAGGATGGGVRDRPHRRVVIQVPSPGGAESPDLRDIRAGVHARQRVLAGALGRGVLAGFPQRRAPEQRLDGIQPPRALRMAGRGDVLAALGMHDQGRTMRGRVVTPSVIVRRRPRGPPIQLGTIGRGGGGHDGRRTGRTAARSRAIAASTPSGAPNTAVPATSTEAPAWTTEDAVSGPSPPSTAIANPSPRERPRSASPRLLASISGMNGCPPLPGSTVITRTAVTTGRTHSISSRGVAGLRATAGSTPSARICWIVW